MAISAERQMGTLDANILHGKRVGNIGFGDYLVIFAIGMADKQKQKKIKWLYRQTEK